MNKAYLVVKDKATFICSKIGRQRASEYRRQCKNGKIRKKKLYILDCVTFQVIKNIQRRFLTRSQAGSRDSGSGNQEGTLYCKTQLFQILLYASRAYLPKKASSTELQVKYHLITLETHFSRKKSHFRNAQAASPEKTCLI